jgi:hypothetical protein
LKLSIRRINATPLPIKAENWRQDRPAIIVYPVSILNSPGFQAQSTLFHCLSGLLTCFKQQAARQPVLLLLAVQKSVKDTGSLL